MKKGYIPKDQRKKMAWWLFIPWLEWKSSWEKDSQYITGLKFKKCWCHKFSRSWEYRGT